ncbi:ArsA family ATPase, partial [Thermodesulfobacteriota bacterium]
MRIILYTGKGGVGKTTTAAATAVKCAEHGHRTIVLSTDAAHSLSDIFETGIGASPTPIVEGLDAQEIDVAYELKHHWGVIQSYITKFLKSQGIEGIMAEEFAIVPGMEELFSLLKLKEYADSGAYEVAIVDCAPTASTLRMLGMPDAVRWYMDKFFHIERRIVKAVKPVAERLTKIPMPTDEIYFSAESLFRRVDAMKDLLTDAGKATVRLVCTPERMVIQESRRAFTTLSLFGLPVDAIITNRVLPEGLDAQYFKKWKTAQRRHIK